MRSCLGFLNGMWDSGRVKEPEIRWPLGEAVMQNNRFVPGGFIFVYGAVIGWKHLARLFRRPARPTLLALPPPDDALLLPLEIRVVRDPEA